LFLSIILIKSEKFLAPPCITVHLPHRSFFLLVQCKSKRWQNAVLGMDKLPYTYTALLMQLVTQVTQGLAQTDAVNVQNQMSIGTDYLLF